VEEGSSSRLPSSQGNGYQPPPNTGIHPQHVSEAEAFLQDVSDSFRPHKMLKVEPVEVQLPPVAPRSVKLEKVRFLSPYLLNFLTCLKFKLHRSSSSSLSSHISSTSKATNPPESVSSSSSLLSQKRPQGRVTPLTPANHMPPPPLPPTIPEVLSPFRMQNI
jgi:hypothetical protein